VAAACERSVLLSKTPPVQRPEFRGNARVIPPEFTGPNKATRIFPACVAAVIPCSFPPKALFGFRRRRRSNRLDRDARRIRQLDQFCAIEQQGSVRRRPARAVACAFFMCSDGGQTDHGYIEAHVLTRLLTFPPRAACRRQFVPLARLFRRCLPWPRRPRTRDRKSPRFAQCHAGNQPRDAEAVSNVAASVRPARVA